VVLGSALYSTRYGSAYVGDSLELLDQLEADSVNLVVTSPPLPCNEKKATVMLLRKHMLIGS